MKILLINLLLFELSFLSCLAPTYSWHIGKSFLATNCSNKNFSDSKINSDSVQTLIGVYENQNMYLNKFPVLNQFNQTTGLTQIYLSEILNQQNKTLIKVNGKFVRQILTNPNIKQPGSLLIFGVTGSEKIADLQAVEALVSKEYQKIRTDLQKKITPAESKLKLKPDLRWQWYFDETTNRLLTVSRQNDLMYVAEIEFLIAGDTQKIKALYAREYFKGEK